MPGRDVCIPRLPRTGGRGCVFAGILAVLALLVLGMAIGSRIASPPEPATQVASEAALPEPVERSPVRPAGPSPARTPSGAVAAAARSITAFNGEVLLEPARLRAVVSRIASRPSRSHLLAVFSEASAQTRAGLGADTTPKPIILLRSVPVGYRVERFSPDRATVAIWYVGIVGSGATVYPQQSWRTQRVELVWEADAWKVASFASRHGPTPPLSNAGAADAPGDLFAAIPSFEEFDRAEP